MARRRRQRPRVRQEAVAGPLRNPVRRRQPSFIKDSGVQIGPGEPPPGFVSAWSSRSEWITYWSLWQVMHEEGDVRKPPFEGGHRFTYQAPIGGGRNILGGQVIDFIVSLGTGEQVGLFVQSSRWHIEGGAAQQALDLARLLEAARYLTVVALYEDDLIRDPTGEQACRTIVESLGGRRRMGPTTTGHYKTSRAGKL